MANTPVLDWPIAEGDEAPANHAAHMAALGEAAERFTVMRFTDAADRDRRLPTPARGMECWLDIPGAYQFYDGTWRWRHAPTNGAETYLIAAYPGSDVLGWNPGSFTQFTGASTFPIPDWARDGSTWINAFCNLHTRLRDSVSTRWRVIASYDGGGNWNSGGIVPFDIAAAGGWFITGTIPYRAGIGETIPSGTTQAKFTLEFQRVSAGGSVDRVANDTVMLWQVGLLPAGSVRPS